MFSWGPPSDRSICWVLQPEYQSPSFLAAQLSITLLIYQSPYGKTVNTWGTNTDDSEQEIWLNLDMLKATSALEQKKYNMVMEENRCDDNFIVIMFNYILSLTNSMKRQWNIYTADKNQLFCQNLTSVERFRIQNNPESRPLANTFVRSVFKTILTNQLQNEKKKYNCHKLNERLQYKIGTLKLIWVVNFAFNNL